MDWSNPLTYICVGIIICIIVLYLRKRKPSQASQEPQEPRGIPTEMIDEEEGIRYSAIEIEGDPQEALEQERRRQSLLIFGHPEASWEQIKAR